MDADGPVDATQNAPPGPWKTEDGFPRAPTAIIGYGKRSRTTVRQPQGGQISVSLGGQISLTNARQLSLVLDVLLIEHVFVDGMRWALSDLVERPDLLRLGTQDGQVAEHHHDAPVHVVVVAEAELLTIA